MSEQTGLWRYETATASCNRHGCGYRDAGPLHQLRECVDEHIRENSHAVKLITDKAEMEEP